MIPAQEAELSGATAFHPRRESGVSHMTTCRDTFCKISRTARLVTVRSQLTTVRRIAVVVALALVAVFVLYPACEAETAHHGAYVPGISGEFCHHGDAHHLSAASPAEATVQTGAAFLTAPEAHGEHAARPAATGPSCPRRPEPSRSGRALLLDLGISRT
jgi:hypothetical protein